ncbi:MAG TPA: GH92 family glycosyl hydrolase [Verrucomicrobiae bacterium]|nr:GH92 family glycosyl hydrolase [Verrucomicrobiae bacterium]
MKANDHYPAPARRKRLLLTFTVGVFLGLHPPLQAYMLQTLTTNVQPLNGTDNGGDEFPGAVVPFGMVQWSPDTTSLGQSGGYLYTDTQIVGFSLDHLSGAGCDYGGNFAFTPILGGVTNSPCANGSNGKAAFPSAFSHADEIAVPGYYSVLFTNGIRTELTATTRTGFGRFTYPAGYAATMLINAASGAAGTTDSSVEINTNTQEISGWTIENPFCGAVQYNTLYFDVVFDHPLAAYGVWNGATLTVGATNATGAQTGVYLSFNLPGGGVVQARTALSYVSVANARANLQAEDPSFSSPDFNDVAGAASNNWNGYLNKIQVSGGTPADTATFYTMMYHALQAPTVVSDVNGQYMGFDGQIHTTAASKYEYFSGWDIYRNECQFIAMMDPSRAGDMAESLVLDAQQCGAMPRWSVADGDSGVMMGDPATPIIAGIYAFGGTNFDTASALAAMVNAAVNPQVVALNGVHERDAERDYLNLGYVPAAQIGGYGPVSMTLEYCSADDALAHFAQSLGDTTNYILAMNRAQNWRNLFNENSGLLQLRNSDALWSPGFPVYNGSAYVEGTAYQYVWMVPFNLGSLIDMMGGPQAASARLDAFFTQLNDADTTHSPFAYMGNEPCSETPWIYNFMGMPYKASSVVRQIMTQLYSTAPGGLPGNDDLGQMASWYVLAALGMHPEIPGDDVLVLNGPLFPQAVVHLTNGDVTITAAGAADDAPYIQSLTVNGRASTASWIHYAQIANGGTLAFSLGTAPDTNWGSNVADLPPSDTDGMTSPQAGNYFWGTGLETNDIQLAWTNTVDTGGSGGGIANVGPILSSLSGPELGVRSENAQSGHNEIMYSGEARGGASDYAYMQMFDLSNQNVTVSPGMRFSYWIFPQSSTNNSLATGSNSLYVALDLIFSDGTTLRNSGLTNQYGVAMNPSNQAAVLALDTWNYVTVDLTPLAGRTVDRIDLGYSQPNSSGGYRGYVDDLSFTTPANWFSNNLALNRPASADSQEPGYPPSFGNDGNLSTRWSAADGNSNHWWEVDLGSLCNLTGDEVVWQNNGIIYDYTVAVSMDNTNWTTVVDKTANTSTAQDQADVFAAAGRYVRIIVTGLPSGDWASFYEFRVFGAAITLPAAPAGLTASAGYGLVSLNWTAPAGATSYTVARSTSSGAETPIATVMTTNYTDAGLANGTTYYYVVSAADLLGSSTNATEVSATPERPMPGSYQAAVVACHPLAYWPLNETNGSIAFDPVGGHNGTYVGGVTLGQPGVPLSGFGSSSCAALFDGTTGYVDIPEGPFDLTNAITTIAWVKVPTTPNFVGIFGHGDPSWRMSVNASGEPGANDGTSNGDATAPSSIVGTNWHMVAYSCTGVPNIPNNGLLYVDGVLVADNTVGELTGDGYDVWIGGSPDYGTGRLLPGSIAHVSVFTNALSPAQILALYQAASIAPPVTLTITQAGTGRLAVAWPQGTLLQSTNLIGPWITDTASSPYTIVPTNSQMYFRAEQ